MTTEEDSLLYRHRLMFAHSSGTPLRAECVRCRQPLKRDFMGDWKDPMGLATCL